MRTCATIAIFMALILAPRPMSAQPLTAGSSTALDPREAAETERVVSQIQKLAEESRRGAPQFSMIGTVNGGGKSWWVNGEEFLIDDSTVITGDLRAGKTVEVRGLLGAVKGLLARQVTVLEAAEGSGQSGRGMSPAEARALR